MSLPGSNITIATSDIAQLAGVARSTVSNWRTRHKDFPQPVAGSAASPRFAAADVRSWLEAHGKKIKDLSPVRVLWNVLDLGRGSASPQELGEFASSLIAWRYVSDPESPGFDNTLPPETWWPHLREHKGNPDDLREQLRRGMDSYEHSHPERAPLFGDLFGGRAGELFDDARRGTALLFRLIQALSDFEASSLGEVYVSFRDHLTYSAGRGYDDLATSSNLVDLIATAARRIPGPVHDPAVGSGRLLLAVGSQGEGRTALTGQDISRDACTQANQRALVTGHNNVTVVWGDVFQDDPFERGSAQVVVMDPPYSHKYHDVARLHLDPRLPYGIPTMSRMDTAWLQLALWSLGSQGRAFVLQPAHSASRGGADAKIRAAMLQAGTVEAVVALPGGLASQTQIPLNLWVLARSGESGGRERVLLIDHSSTKDIDIDAIANALQGWREHRVVPGDLSAGAFTLAEILAAEADLTPQRWLASTDEAPSLEAVRAHVESLHAAVAQTRQLDKLTDASLAAGTQTPRMVSVADLVKAETLTVLRAKEQVREKDYGSEGSPVVTAQWIRGNDEEPRRIHLGLLEREPVITEPGDVLVQSAGELAARVDTEGGRVLLNMNVHLLRLQGDALKPQYLAEFLTTSRDQRRTPGSALKGISLKDLMIPLLPVDEQERVLERVAEIRTVQHSAQTILEAAGTTRRELVEAITAGTIEIN